METNTYMNHIYGNHHIYVTLLAIFQYIAMHFDTTPISQCAAREFLESRPDKFLVTPTTGRPWAMGWKVHFPKIFGIWKSENVEKLPDFEHI